LADHRNDFTRADLKTVTCIVNTIWNIATDHAQF